MKHPEDDWEHDPCFEGMPPVHPPFEANAPGEEPPQFSAIRRIELLGRLHHMAFRSVMPQNGLPPAQAGALQVIIRSPGLSQRELADKLHIQRATATVMLQKMEKAGYIDRRPDQGDQRISRIYSTPLAEAIDAENQKTVNSYFLRCFEGIDDAAFAALEQSLDQLDKNLRAILREHPDPNRKE